MPCLDMCYALVDKLHSILAAAASPAVKPHVTAGQRYNLCLCWLCTLTLHTCTLILPCQAKPLFPKARDTWETHEQGEAQTNVVRINT